MNCQKFTPEMLLLSQARQEAKEEPDFFPYCVEEYVPNPGSSKSWGNIIIPLFCAALRKKARWISWYGGRKNLTWNKWFVDIEYPSPSIRDSE